MTGQPTDAGLLSRLERIARALEERPKATTGEVPPPGQVFLWEPEGGFRTARRFSPVDPSLLVGITRQQQLFYGNLRRFAAGAPAHDVLLWGERGTGKSSLVRSALTAVENSALALLAVAEDQLSALPTILDRVAEDPRRWVLFCDDLSFLDTDTRYKEFKVVLEGGLEARPENTLLVATSNRRHLVPERFGEDGEIHPEETVAEQVSLADRFGLSLGFYAFDQKQYLDAVARHLTHLSCELCPESWQTEALRWAMARGIRSGRSALHAARELAGRRAVP